MVRLVSQFDNEKTRVSLATPTCGGCCCCCCCCLVSTIVTGNISGRSFGKMIEAKEPEYNKKLKATKIFGYLWPIIGIICAILSLILATVLIGNGIAYEILPFGADFVETITIFGGLLGMLIMFEIICIKILHNITHNEKSAKKFIGLSIKWIILLIIETIAVLIVVVNGL